MLPRELLESWTWFMRWLSLRRAGMGVRRRPATRVLLVASFEWHRGLMDPLLPLLSQWASPAMVGVADIVKGSRPAFDPDVVVVCDAGFAGRMRKVFGDTCIIHVGHGLISKNQTAYHYGNPDYICVASEFVADMFTERGHVPRIGFLPTGLMQMDPLFSSHSRSRRAQEGKTIAYAPTWNATLSSAEMIGPEIVRHLAGSDDSVRIKIKPHPHIPVADPGWMTMWQAVADRAPQVQLCDPASDLIPTLLEADLLVSDASSAIFHFLALDRPMVLIDNPERFSDPECFDPEGIEWQWRDIGAQVTDVADLSAAVRDELAHPDVRGDIRRQRRSQLFGSRTDGRSAQRINREIQRIARSLP